MKHWTDSHIIYEESTGFYIGYDEAGLQHCCSKNKEDVVLELEKYTLILNTSGDER